MINRLSYKVIPLPVVQKESFKILTKLQIKEAIRHVKKLRDYPFADDLSLEPCGLGIELRISSSETGEINKQGWLRCICWIFEPKRTIYIVDLFWKKTSRISKADLIRADQRIRQLKLSLSRGEIPWQKGNES